tara:strand:+ start:85 stop:264 length:180 start_codon:yes stop_codon:yes gene_type:complete
MEEDLNIMEKWYKLYINNGSSFVWKIEVVYHPKGYIDKSNFIHKLYITEEEAIKKGLKV